MTTTTKVKGYGRLKLLFTESERIEASQYLVLSAPIEALNT